MDISIIFATFKRPQILAKMLDSFTKLKTADLRWEIVLVDNADDEATREVVAEFHEKLPLTYLIETKRGKNNALNRALSEALGDLFVFTDDDVIADENWLTEMWAGVKRWPDTAVFGGRILPDIPVEMFPVSLESSFAKGAYAIADWQINEGIYKVTQVWGANMAIRAHIFRGGWQFNANIGPDGSTTYTMGSEAELVMRLCKAGFSPVFLPASLVYHQIRPEQLKIKWLYKRAFRSGRGSANIGGRPDAVYFLGIPRYLWREIIEAGWQRIINICDSKEKYNAGIRFWMTLGKIAYYREESCR